MKEKIELIQSLFSETLVEDAPKGDTKDLPKNVPIKHGKFYGGIYNGRKYMYSEYMIETLSIEKLEAVIRKQIGL